jgi:hypothetical protein
VEWEKVTLLTIGFGLYCLALTFRSTSLKRLRFARIVDLAQIRHVSRRYRAWMFAGSLAVSVVLMGIALFLTINTDRDAFKWLGYLGAMLAAVRLLGFVFTHVSLIAFEIEIDPRSKFSFTHLLRSPFILGGLMLVIVGFGVPRALDSLLMARFHSYQLTQWQALDDKAEREGFKAKYEKRTLIVNNVREGEDDFFSRELGSGSRIVIEGRGGIGKTWFLMQMQFDSRLCELNRAVVFLTVADLVSRTATGKVTVEEVLDHISHAAFGGLAWFALPVTRQIVAARALILIDGLDEVQRGTTRDLIIGAISHFAQDKTLEQDTLVVTTRPIGKKPFPDFKTQVKMTLLVESQSLDELGSESSRVRKLTKDLQKLLGQRPPDLQTLSLFYTGPVLDWSQITSAQTAQIYRSFGYTFGFLNRAQDPETGEMRLPFLSTYRDIDIFEKLFVETITGAFGPPPRTSAEMQARLIDRFLRLRIAMNYYALKLSDAKIHDASAERIIEKLTIVCANYLRRAPQDITTFTFNRELFGEIMPSDVPPFDAVVEESELLTEKAGHLVFNNPGLDEYFLARARDQLSPQVGAPQ